MRVTDGTLELDSRDGEVLRYPAVWLRDNCSCPDCADPVTGQKLHDITDIPPDCAVLDASVESVVTVTFGPDGHRGEFPRDWLLARALDGYPPDPREEDGKALWRTPADLCRAAGSVPVAARPGAGPGPGAPVPAVAWAGYIADPAARAAALRDVVRYGCVLLTGVPAGHGMVLEVARSFGFVRETNYGKLFDVRIEPAPDNLAFTSKQIRPHTDNPYRDPVPTVQLLHCLRTAGEGGETALVDGFAAAADLRHTDPDAFSAVAGTSVPFGYEDEQTWLRASMPLIQLSPRGRVRGIRFNNRSMQPLRAPYERVTAFYAAYRRWAELLAEPARRARLRLTPGDCLVFDNTRVLHARTAFSVTGGRHLQGCYADLDGLMSTLEVLGDR
jgi:gamma-butyrobetaine dioxygenase